MKFKNILLVVLISAATAILSVWGFGKYMESTNFSITQDTGKLPVNYAGFFEKNNEGGGPVDFTQAANAATPAVVHIKTVRKERKLAANQRRSPFSDLFGDNDPFSDFFGGPNVIPEQRASGSGVLVSNDGYIVTNNHVVEDADIVNVTTAEKRSYKGTVIATDPNSDLAVIKIEGKNFPYLVYGNSDAVTLGQWVLAIGYPLTLDVTVTAGIISAKARSIGINKGENPIESFLQTDAAVNPGNSGGALINTAGELIGINSAIASPTGSYAGYSYAIPVNIVKKIVGDLIKYGTVQRAYVGISYPNENLTEDQKKQLGIEAGGGVFVLDVAADGAAAQAGIKKGDFITKINGVEISTGPELQDQIARYKPGDKITVTFTRDGKENTLNLALKNKSGTYAEVVKTNALEQLGGQLENISKSTAEKNNIQGGVVVKSLGNGPLKNSRMQEGFVITSVNGRTITNLDDLEDILQDSRGTVRLEGIYPGYEGVYGYPVNIHSGR